MRGLPSRQKLVRHADAVPFHPREELNLAPSYFPCVCWHQRATRRKSTEANISIVGCTPTAECQLATSSGKEPSVTSSPPSATVHPRTRPISCATTTSSNYSHARRSSLLFSTLSRKPP